MLNYADNQNKNNFYIRYYPQFSGLQKTSLILDRLEYWFKHPKFHQGFFKFLEPCQHHLYRQGDSWAEEIGITRRLFNAAFDLVGVRYNSKSQFLMQDDPFHGRLYASYYDRRSNQMHYVRNHAIADTYLKGLFERQSSRSKAHKNAPSKTDSTDVTFVVASRLNNTFPSATDRTLLTKQKTDLKAVQTHKKTLSNCRSRNDTKRHSCGGTIGGRYDNKELQTLSQEEKDTIEQMKQTWQSHVGKLEPASSSQRVLRQMLTSLKENFKGSLDLWQKYCRTIASSKFLMGEVVGTQFKAWLRWAIKPSAIERIEGEEFKLGDRIMADDINAQAIRTEQLDQLCAQNIARQPDAQHQQLHQALKAKFGINAYYHWFRDLKVQSIQGRDVMLSVASQFHQNMINNRYSIDLMVVIQQIFNNVRTFQWKKTF